MNSKTSLLSFEKESTGLVKGKKTVSDELVELISSMVKTFAHDSCIHEFSEKLLTGMGSYMEIHFEDEKTYVTFARNTQFIEALDAFECRLTLGQSQTTSTSSFASHGCYELTLFMLLGLLDKTQILKSFVKSVSVDVLHRLLTAIGTIITHDYRYLTQVGLEIISRLCHFFVQQDPSGFDAITADLPVALRDAVNDASAIPDLLRDMRPLLNALNKNNPNVLLNARAGVQNDPAGTPEAVMTTPVRRTAKKAPRGRSAAHTANTTACISKAKPNTTTGSPALTIDNFLHNSTTNKNDTATPGDINFSQHSTHTTSSNKRNDSSSSEECAGNKKARKNRAATVKDMENERGKQQPQRALGKPPLPSATKMKPLTTTTTTSTAKKRGGKPPLATRSPSPMAPPPTTNITGNALQNTTTDPGFNKRYSSDRSASKANCVTIVGVRRSSFTLSTSTAATTATNASAARIVCASKPSHVLTPWEASAQLGSERTTLQKQGCSTRKHTAVSLVNIAANIERTMMIFLLLFSLCSVNGFLHGFGHGVWRNKIDTQHKRPVASYKSVLAADIEPSSVVGAVGRTPSVSTMPKLSLKPAQWIRSVFSAMVPSSALINRTSCLSTCAAGYDTQCIIDEPSITMSNPLLGLNLTFLTDTVLDVARGVPGSRRKPLLATVRGTGGGKTRLFEEIRRELQKNSTVLPIAITFNLNTNIDNEEFRAPSASWSAALSIVARMASAFYGESFATIQRKMTTQKCDFGVLPDVVELYTAFVQLMRKQLQQAGCNTDQFVLLIDETVKLLEALNRFYPDERGDPLSALRTALLDKADDAALALSSLDVAMQGLTDSGRPLEALLPSETLDPNEIVTQWWGITDDKLRYRLQLIAAVLCDLPRALEVANTYIQDHRTEISAPHFCEALVGDLRKKLRRRYLKAPKFVPSPRLLWSMIFMRSCPLDAHAAMAIRASVVTNVLDDEIGNDVTKEMVFFRPRANLFMLALGSGDPDTFYSRFLLLLDEVFKITVDSTTKTEAEGDLLEQHTALVLNARVGVSMNAGATVTVAELLGISPTGMDSPLRTKIKFTADMADEWTERVETMQYSSNIPAEAARFLKEVENLEVSPEMPIQLRRGAARDGYDVMLKVYDSTAPGQRRYFFVENKSLQETEENARRLFIDLCAQMQKKRKKKRKKMSETIKPRQFPKNESQAKKLCALMSKLPTSTTFVYLTTHYVAQAVYKPPLQPNVMWVYGGRNQTQTFMGPLWDLHRVSREGWSDHNNNNDSSISA